MLTDPGQTSPANDFVYDGVSQTYTYNEITATPSWCQVQVNCLRVEGPSNYLTCLGADLNPPSSINYVFGEADYLGGLTPGQYKYIYEASVGDKKLEFEVILNLVDPCLNPTIIKPDPTTSTIFVQDAGITIPFSPAFEVQPSFCTNVIDGPTDVPDPLDPNPTPPPGTLCNDNSCIEIPPIDTLEPVDPIDPSDPLPPCRDYKKVTEIKVTAINGQEITESVESIIKVCNPCLDADHVTITAPSAFDSQDYIIEQGLVTTTAHGEFVESVANSHDLCGPITCTPSFDGNDLPFDDGKTQVTYNDLLKSFDVTSTDLDLAGMTKLRKVYCEYENYPKENYPPSEYPDADVPNAE